MRRRLIRTDVLVGGALISAGVVLAFVLPPNEKLHGPYRRISAIIGWIYFLAWSVSFYPQVVLNYRRKTTIGLSFDFQLYNLLGFTCYSIYTSAFYWSTAVQREYEHSHNGNSNKIEPNDVAFAIHAVAITCVTIAQVIYYDHVSGHRPSRVAISAVLATTAFLAVHAVVAAILSPGASHPFHWTDWLSAVSFVKLAVTLVKYIPQAALNARRRSTQGWSIYNVLLDFTGGLLSLLQLLLDCGNTRDWSGIVGTPVKFGLGLTSMVFDVVFLTQHYVLYPSVPDIVGDKTYRKLASRSEA
ncbi:putative lysosomal cystine transporter family [Tribonema minus]|uniref:Putative lysosomal cystine transporter family n=1 Tax=Tribonema minus TaxID=303371 RepID=A0A836C9F4_9STRA|nr:putative lysosomal cystine transporter family [Tribonema minus]